MLNDAMIRALATALYYAKHYDDSNPDVGFGPSLETLAERVCRHAEVNHHPTNIDVIVAAYRAKWE